MHQGMNILRFPSLRTNSQHIILAIIHTHKQKNIKGGSNMTGTDLYVNKRHCAAAVRP